VLPEGAEVGEVLAIDAKDGIWKEGGCEGDDGGEGDDGDAVFESSSG